MATITFKAKAETIFDMDDTPLYDYIIVPQFGRRHCDMAAFRVHPKYGGLANSDLFQGVLNKIRKDTLNGRAWLRLDQLPENVKVDRSKFLAVVTIEV